MAGRVVPVPTGLDTIDYGFRIQNGVSDEDVYRTFQNIQDYLREVLNLSTAPGKMVSQLLENGTPSTSLAFNGSVTSDDFDFTASGETYVYKINALIVDGAQDPNKFGGLTALTNGLLVKVIDSDGTTVLHDPLDGGAIKKNADWSYLARHTEVVAGAGDDEFSVDWKLEDSFGGPLKLLDGQIIRMTVQDDLTGLTEFRVMVQARTA